MIRPAPTVASLAAYALADLPGGLVSLAQNESMLPPSPLAAEAGRAALEDAMLYPDPEWTALREALADCHDLDPRRILCGAGSMELIDGVIRAFAGPGDAVLGTQYGYLFAATACQRAGARHDRAPEADCTVSVDAILAALRPETRIVFLCNPGNPTGTRLPNGELRRLRDSLSGHILLVVDEAYAEFDGQEPLFDLIDRGDTVITRTFSKAHALAGARVGWGVFPPAISQEVRKLLNPNNVSGVSQAMARAAVSDAAHMRRIVAETAAVREEFAAALRRAGYHPVPSRTNFVLLPFAGAEAAARADRALRAAGFLLRNVAAYGLDTCLRATIGDGATMARVAAVLEDLAENPA